MSFRFFVREKYRKINSL